MPRRTLVLILGVALVSLVCYRRAEKNPYGRHFAEVLDQIDRDYVEAVDNQKLFEGAIDGMVGRLDDYSAFISRQDKAQFQEVLDQEFGGVGIEVLIDPATQALMVLSPLVGTPAYAAGVQAGDRIVAIDGQDTKGFALKDALPLLRGKPGAPVTLSVTREGQEKPLDFTMKREVITVKSVLGDLHSPDGNWDFLLKGHEAIGYLRITTFGAQTQKELSAALNSLEKQHCRGVIIDLRNNPGGLLTAATGACDMLLGKGDLIVNTRGRDAQVREEWRASGNGTHQRLPLVVMVNHFSASASEIMAAALQDHERAVIVGERSWGKGTVQNVIPVEGGKSMLKLTTASYWRPSGQNIHRLKTSELTDEWGVKPDPDREVKLTEKELSRWLEYRRKRDVVQPPGKSEACEIDLEIDPQLKAALESLESKTPAPASGQEVTASR